MALLGIEVGRDWYSTSQMESPIVYGLMSKIEIEIDPTAEEAFWSKDQNISTVTICMRDGKSFSARVDQAPGHWTRPTSDADLEEKFLRNVRGTALQGFGEKIVETTMRLGQLHSMGELFDLLSAARFEP